MKKLLILGGSVFQTPFVKRAKSMGIYVGLVDINNKADAVKYADVYYQQSIIDKEKVLEIAEEFIPDGIAVGTCETAMHTAAFIAEKLSLPFLSQATVDKATNKLLMLYEFDKYGVPAPKYRVVRNYEKIKWDFDFPVITKPVDKSASKGISYARNYEELDNAVMFSMSESDIKEVLIEEYLDGPEVSVEIVMEGHNPIPLQVTDKITSGIPNYIEIGQIQPSNLIYEKKEQLIKCACDAAKSLGLSNCAVHAELKMTATGPKMIEIAARMGGHYIDSYLLENSSGYDLQSAVIRYSLGEKMHIDKSNINNKHCAMMGLLSNKGVISDIAGIEEAKQIPNVLNVVITAQIGEKFDDGKSNNDLIGYVVAVGYTHREAIDTCKKAIDTINILYDDK